MVWGSNNEKVYRWNGGSEWERMNGNLNIVTCGEAGVFALNTTYNYVYYYSGSVGQGAITM